MLSLYKLEIFAMAAEVGSFSRAAEHLYMTQSAVSQHIQDLERSLGTRLFDRGRRGVTLTASGKTLFDYTQQILLLVAQAEADVTNVENLEEGQVMVGATPGVSVYLLPGWIGSFQQQYDHLTVSLMTDVTDRIAEKVLARHLDLGFVEGEIAPTDDLGVVPLHDINLTVIVGRTHPWWEESQVPSGSLDGHAFIMRQAGSQTRVWVEAILERRGCRPRIVGEFDNPESIKQAVISGMGVTIMPEYAVEREVEQGLLRSLPIGDLDLRRTLSLIWYKHQPFAPVTRAFLQAVQSALGMDHLPVTTVND